jgi:hypothetical protein
MHPKTQKQQLEEIALDIKAWRFVRQMSEFCCGVWVNNYLKQFYRSSTAQDALIKTYQGENNMVIGATPEIRKQNNEAWQEALRQQEQKVAIEVGNKIELVMEFMRATNPLKYTLNDLFENVILCLKKDGQFSPQKERLARQMIYGEKSNESH